MKVYDCFLFNDELQLLSLRLHFLDDAVDYFVLVESKRTLAGSGKPLHFANHQHLFAPFLHKIIYLQAPVNNLPAWEYEYFQRDYIREGLKHCKDEDWIHISDVDEIPNLKEIIPAIEPYKAPVLVKVPMFYYWLNLLSNKYWAYNLLGKWKDIKPISVGYRGNEYYTSFKKFADPAVNTGWHFSYLFGTDIKKYQEKIRSFAHQEYNKPYYLNPERIYKCIVLGVDLFERPQMRFQYTNKYISPLLPHVEQLGLSRLIQQEKKQFTSKDLLFLFIHIYPKKFLYSLAVPFVYSFEKAKWLAKKILKPVIYRT